MLTLESKDVFLQWHTDDVNSMTASKVTINVAQQLALQYLFKVNEASLDGINTYETYSNSINNHVENPDSYDYVYGWFQNGSQIVAVWQGFAQHLAHTIANQVFGWGENSFGQQGKTWTSGGGISSSAKYLEGFDPTIGSPYDYLNWIPVGLINDLMDSQSDPFPVNDNVSGFTYADIQAAYYTEPTTMLEFKNALKAIKPAQSTAIDQLFLSYAY